MNNRTEQEPIMNSRTEQAPIVSSRAEQAPIMSSRAKELIYRYFINQFIGKPGSFVGVEIEMPVVNLEKRPVAPEFLRAMAELLERGFGFRPDLCTSSGFPIKAANDRGDVFSFETSFNTIEFSMARRTSVTEAAKDFHRYLTALKRLEKVYGHVICGMGTNPYAEYADGKPLDTPLMTAKSQFLKTFTTHRDGEIFHGFSASTQTHLDTSLADLPDKLNLLSKLAFADAILFANSLPFPHEREGWAAGLPAGLRDELENPFLCFRDVLWDLCEAPNTRAYDREYGSVEDIADHMASDLAVFIIGDGKGGYRPIRPVKLAEYFADQNRPEEDILCFRSLEPAAVTRHGTIEIRQTCTQPLSRVFAPVAFYTGIMENYQKAAALADAFLCENRIRLSGPALRGKAVRQAAVAPPEILAGFIQELLGLSLEGLKQRNFGEEQYLKGLYKAEGFTGGLAECPAKKQLRLLEEGAGYEEIIALYGEADEGADRAAERQKETGGTMGHVIAMDRKRTGGKANGLSL
jgi:gamma-glutamylcysteine synthetase